MKAAAMEAALDPWRWVPWVLLGLSLVANVLQFVYARWRDGYKGLVLRSYVHPGMPEPGDPDPYTDVPHAHCWAQGANAVVTRAELIEDGRWRRWRRGVDVDLLAQDVANCETSRFDEELPFQLRPDRRMCAAVPVDRIPAHLHGRQLRWRVTLDEERLRRYYSPSFSLAVPVGLEPTALVTRS